jgi:hypothetical protein
MPKVTRTRDLTPYVIKGAKLRHFVQNGPPLSNQQESASFDASNQSKSYVGKQTTVSEGHPWHSRQRGSGDIGGDFTTTKSYVVGDAGGRRHYRWTIGPWDVKPYQNAELFELDAQTVAVDPTTFSWPTFPNAADYASSEAKLAQMGATAVARCSPTNPVSEASVFLGELVKDGLPSIPGLKAWENKLAILRSAGDEFLNAVFGWAPLVSDVKSTSKAIRHATAVMRQFERDSGRVVRRRYNFPIDRTRYTMQKVRSNVPPYYGPVTSGSIGQYFGSGDVYVDTQVSKSTWFSGAFTYYAPSGFGVSKGMDSAAAEAQRVFGLELTPETLWNLAPWSWAVDWVSNAGDVIHNLSDKIQYGQVMKYGYIMETIVVQDTYTWRRNSAQSYSGPSDVPALSFVTVTKKRRRANPFGFGISWDGLSPIQNAILAALGLSHSR